MFNILKAAIKSNNVISFCLGKVDWNKRVIGYVKAINKNKAVINVIDIFGNTVSTKNILIDKIAILEINDSYNKHLEKLKTQGQEIKKTRNLYYYNKGNGFNEKIEFLRLNGNICTFFFGTEYMTGIVKGINDQILIIDSIGYRGTNEGESFCKMENITKIRYDGPLEKKITFLKNE
jgi:hypothetical protein